MRSAGPNRTPELPIDFRYECLRMANSQATEETSETTIFRAKKYARWVTQGSDELRPWRLEVLRLAIAAAGEDADTVVERAKEYMRFLEKGDAA
jgi:hypothetical protein